MALPAADRAFPVLDPGTLAAVREATRLLVGVPDRLEAEADRVRQLLEPLDPQRVLDYWLYERVLALAVDRARVVGVRHLLWSAAAADQRDVAVGKARAQLASTRQVGALLRGAGISFVVLKGPLMAERLYGDLSLRAPSSDLDILVSRADLFRARDVLVSEGWAATADPLLAEGLPMHHLVLGGDGERPGVELHWRVQWYDRDHGDDLVARATAGDLPEVSDRDLLDVLLLCWVRDGFHGVRLAADIAAWWTRFGGTAAGQAPSQARASTLGRPLGVGALAAASLVGTPAAEAVGGRAAALALRVAREDRPCPPRQALASRHALIDVLACPPSQRRQRFFSTWAWAPAIVRAEHPAAPRAAVPLLRAAGACRTAWDVARTLLGR